MEGEVKSYEEAGSCFWCNDGLGPFGGTNLLVGDVGDKVGCKGAGGEKDQFGVVEHEGNGGRVGREGSLVNEGSLVQGRNRL